MDPKKSALSLVDEFKTFAFKGNVVDLAVGVIIGGAFGKIIDSLVKYIIMPTVSMLLPGDQGYLHWAIALNGKEIPYGLFIGEIVNFVIVAAALFLFIVKFLGWLMKNKEDKPVPLTKQEQLLIEIRDLLKNKP